MLSSDYLNYVEGIIRLVRSLVIKYPYTITALNNYMSIGGDVLSPDPNEWKFYRNVSGQRYIGIDANNVSPSKMSDPIITIYSLDNNTIIPFTPASLASNPVTLADLRTYGTTYNNLLSLYPTQDLLIRGVLNPVNITTAINADPFTILYYDNSQLGANESTLIDDLQVYIDNYFSRWDVAGFAITDPLYPAANFSIFTLGLVTAIINIRLKNCKTQQAHEFHIWNYLGGYFNLDVNKNILPNDQALWLYRNIDYITANTGSKKILDYLNTNFANPYGLQLYNFSIRKDLGDSLNQLNKGNLTNLSKNVSIAKYPYGLTNLSADNVTELDTQYIVNALQNSALLNPLNIDLDNNTLIDSALKTESMEIPIGVIEANVVTRITSTMVNITSEKIHNWLYLTANNFIKYKIVLSLPAEGLGGLDLNANDAATLLLYVSSKYFNQDLVSIGTPLVRDIMTFPTVGGVIGGTAMTPEQIKSVIESKYLTGSIPQANPVLTWDRYNDVVNMQTYPNEILSISDFNTYINAVVNNKIKHRLLPTLETDIIGKLEVSSLINLFYQNYSCKFVTETLYTDFFNRLGINPNQWSNSSLLTTMNYILQQYCNIQPETNTLESPYSNMVDILATLCSYTLTFISGLASNDIEVLDLDFPIFSVPGDIIVDNVAIISNGLDSLQYLPFTRDISYGIEYLLDSNSTLNTDIITDIKFNIDNHMTISSNSENNIFNTSNIISFSLIG